VGRQIDDSESSAVPKIRGATTATVMIWKAMIGTTTITHPVTAKRTQGFSCSTRGSTGRPGRKLSRIGRIRWNRSGTPTRSATT
jgi:hypothetical protein